MRFLDQLRSRRALVVLAALELLVALPCVIRLWTDERLQASSHLIMQRAMHAQWARLYGLDVASRLTSQPVALVSLNVLLLLALPLFVVALVAPAELRGLSSPTLREALRRVMGAYVRELVRAWLLLALGSATVVSVAAWKLNGAGLSFSLQALGGVLVSATFYVALGVAARVARSRAVAYVLLVGALGAFAALKVLAHSPSGVGHFAPGVHDGWLLAGSLENWVTAAAITLGEAALVLLAASIVGVWRAKRDEKERVGLARGAAMVSGSKGAWA